MNQIDPVVPYDVRRRKPNALRCALLVIDMQEYFDGMTARIVEGINDLVKTCRENGIPVIFTRHGHKDPGTDGGMLGEWWGDLIEYGTPQWELRADLNVKSGDMILDKNRYSAFSGTNLDQMLRNIDRDELIITGVMTNCCCETTARDGFVRDYRIFFATDGTATVNQDLHLASLKTLAFGFAYLATVEELIDSLKH